MTPLKLTHLPTSTILKYLFGIIAVGLIASYIIFQARVFIAGPQVYLIEMPVTQATKTVTLEGMAHNITEISLNGRPITTDENGKFSENIILENGYTIVSIRAKDRYGRETKLDREFVYTPLSLITN